MKQPIFRGVCTALVTPFRGEDVDYDAFDRLLERQLAAGVDAVLVCGTTGEAPTLEDREKLSLIARCCRTVDGRCRVLAGTGSNDTRHAAALSRAAGALGVDGLLCVTPYYNRCTREGLIAHYSAVAEASPVPVLLYNVPTRTGVDLTPEVCAVLAEHPRICGVKEAAPDVGRVLRLGRLCGPDFPVFCGCDDRMVPFLSCGACGVVSVLSNLDPRRVRRLYDLCAAGDFPRAAELQRRLLPLIDALFSAVNPIPIKQALGLSGLPVGTCRLPLTPPDEGLTVALRTCMEPLGLLAGEDPARGEIPFDIQK